MNVGLLLITHNKIGETLLDGVRSVLGELPLVAQTLAVTNTMNIDEALTQAQAMCRQLDTGKGVLVLTDLYAASPDNIGEKLCQSTNVRAISGVNLPMLMKVMNYYQLPLSELTEKAAAGGNDGIQIHSA